MRCDSRKGLEEVWKGAKVGGEGRKGLWAVRLVKDGDGEADVNGT